MKVVFFIICTMNLTMFNRSPLMNYISTKYSAKFPLMFVEMRH